MWCGVQCVCACVTILYHEFMLPICNTALKADVQYILQMYMWVVQV